MRARSAAARGAPRQRRAAPRGAEQQATACAARRARPPSCAAWPCPRPPALAACPQTGAGSPPRGGPARGWAPASRGTCGTGQYQGRTAEEVGAESGSAQAPPVGAPPPTAALVLLLGAAAAAPSSDPTTSSPGRSLTPCAPPAAELPQPPARGTCLRPHLTAPTPEARHSLLDLLRRLVVDVRVAALDELHRKRVQLVKVVGGVSDLRQASRQYEKHGRAPQRASRAVGQRTRRPADALPALRPAPPPPDERAFHGCQPSQLTISWMWSMYSCGGGEWQAGREAGRGARVGASGARCQAGQQWRGCEAGARGARAPHSSPRPACF